MSKLLRIAAWMVLLVVLVLWGLSVLGIWEEGRFVEIWGQIKDAGRQAEESVNEFIDESGLKEGAEELARKGGEWVQDAAGALEKATQPPTLETA